MRTRQHAAGDIAGLEAVLQEDSRRVAGALAGTAEDEDIAVVQRFLQARTIDQVGSDARLVELGLQQNLLANVGDHGFLVNLAPGSDYLMAAPPFTNSVRCSPPAVSSAIVEPGPWGPSATIDPNN